MTQTAVVVGVDVSKDGLDVALASAGEVQRFANDARGRAQLMKWLKRVGAGLVAYEASGGYERPLALALDRAVGALTKGIIETWVFASSSVRRYFNRR